MLFCCIWNQSYLPSLISDNTDTIMQRDNDDTEKQKRNNRTFLGKRNFESFINHSFAAIGHFYFSQEATGRVKRSVNESCPDCYSTGPREYSSNQYLLEYAKWKQLGLCPNINLCTTHIISNVSSNSCCGECSCSKDCRQQKSCCPDVPGITLEPYDNKTKCVETSFKLEYCQKKFWMISSCPQYIEKSLDISCEGNNGNVSMILQRLPVSSMDSHIVYRNRFCSLCNSETKYVNWRLKIVCSNGSQILKSDIRELELELELQKDDFNVVFLPPVQFEAQTQVLVCSENETTTVVDQCNITGKWIAHNKTTDVICQSYTSWYRRLFITYQNFFCFLCNGGNTDNLTEDAAMCLQPTVCINDRSITFSSTIIYNEIDDIDNGYTVKESKCTKIQFYDANQVCR